MAYYEAEPWGEERADLRIGLLACAMEALVVGSAHAKWTPQMFVIDPTRKSDEPDGDQLARSILMWAESMQAAKGSQ